MAPAALEDHRCAKTAAERVESPEGASGGAPAGDPDGDPDGDEVACGRLGVAPSGEDPVHRKGGSASRKGPLDWRRWLAGASSREVLARLVQGDPLAVSEKVGEYLRREALVLSRERTVLRALARIAHAAPRYRGRPGLSTWLESRIEEATHELLEEDADLAAGLRYAESGFSTGGQSGSDGPRSVLRSGGARFLSDFSKPLGLDEVAALRMGLAFHRQPKSARQAFYDMVLDHRGLDESARRASKSATQTARLAREVLVTLLRAARPSPSPAPEAFPRARDSQEAAQAAPRGDAQ